MCMVVLDLGKITNPAPKCAQREINHSIASTVKWVTNLHQSIKTLLKQVGQIEGGDPKAYTHPSNFSIPRK